MASKRLAGSLLVLILITGCRAPVNQNQQVNANKAEQAGGTVDENGSTELKQAVDKNDVESAKKLIESGAKVNEGNRAGVTPLMVAAGFGNKEMAELLVSNGADVNAKTDSDYTALMAAALSGQAEMVKFLLDHGADPAVKDKVTNKTAVDIAKEKEHSDIVKMLNERSSTSK